MERLFAVILLVLFGASKGFAADLPAKGDFVVPERATLQGVPAIVHDSNSDRFFAAWTDSRDRTTSELDIYGRIFDSEGRPVSPDIAITRAKGGQGLAAVAFDPTRNRYLVVWTDWRDAITTDSDIYGQFVKADGRLDGQEFPIARMRVSQKYPSIAFDPVTRRFLVAWRDQREILMDKIYGQFLSSDGSPEGAAFRLVDGGGRQERPSVLYDSKRRRFFVVWRDSAEHRGIYATFIDAEKGPQGVQIEIAVEDDGCLPPSLYAAGYAPEEDVFLVSWTSGWNYAEQGLDVYATFVDGRSGQIKGQSFPVAAKNDYQESAAVTYDPNGRRFLIVWYDLRRDHTAMNMDIYGRFVTPQGRMSEEFLVSDHQAPGVKRYPAVSFSPKSDVFLVLWEDGRNREQFGRQIFGRIH